MTIRLYLLFCVVLSATADVCLTCTYESGACQSSDKHANCTKCPKALRDVHSVVKSIVANSDSVARRLCETSTDVSECLAATETANDILEEITMLLFPKKPSESSQLLTCSHLLFLCPDEDSKKNKLEDGSWSCGTCETFLDNLFKVLRTPLLKLNNAISEVFCPKKESECLSEFTNAVQISGLLGDFIEDKRTATAVCKFLKCIY